MPWAHAIGVYLLAGTIFMGLGLIVRAGWIRCGKIKGPHGRIGKATTYLGIALGFLFWPLFLAGIAIAWKLNKRRKVEKFLGYCEHATAFDPICSACQRDIERQNASATAPVTLGRRDLLNRPLKIPIGEIMRGYYICTTCGVEHDGFPPATNPEGKPLCKSCGKVE